MGKLERLTGICLKKGCEQQNKTERRITYDFQARNKKGQ